MKYTQHIFSDFGQEYLVIVNEDGKTTLKVKENGRWQAPLYPARTEVGEYAH